MQFSSFSRLEEDLTITLYNDIPVENVLAVKYYNDDSNGTFTKKEFRWSFNNAYWSSWETLTQSAISNIDTQGNYYLFLQIRYILFAADSGTVASFILNYTKGAVTAVTPRILTHDIQSQDASAVLIHDILQTYEVTHLIDASTLNGYPGSYYLNRAHHIGKQPISSITNLQSILDSKANKSGDIISGDLIVDGSFIALGDTQTNGSWRFRIVDASLYVERLVNGNWEIKSTFN